MWRHDENRRFMLSLFLAILFHGAAAMLLPRVLAPKPVIELPQMLRIVLAAKQAAPTPTAQSKPELVQKTSQAKAQPRKSHASAQIKTAVAAETFTMPAATADQPQTPATEQASTAPATEPSSSTSTQAASSAPPGLVASPQFNADYLSNPAPEYPGESRANKEEGKVLLRVHVTEEGQPDEITLHRSSGFSRLDQVSLAVVERWKFIPGRQDGRPVAAWVVVPINFTLRK